DGNGKAIAGGSFLATQVRSRDPEPVADVWPISSGIIRPRRRAWLRIFVVRCGLPCDPPVGGGHSRNGGMIPRFMAARLMSTPAEKAHRLACRYAMRPENRRTDDRRSLCRQAGNRHHCGVIKAEAEPLRALPHCSCQKERFSEMVR